MSEIDVSEQERRILLLPPTAKDAAASRAVLEAAGLHVRICRNVEELCLEATHGAGALLLPEESLASDRSGRLSRLLSDQPTWSDLPLIILTPSGRESPRSLSMFDDFANVTLIKRPIELSVFVSTIRAALRDRMRQYQVRSHLALLRRQADELVQSELALREANRQKDEFLAMLAHELRNPLSAVGNAVRVLQFTSNPEGLQFARQVIERQTRQLGRLIDDLLDVSRINTGKIRLKQEWIDLRTVLDETLELAMPLIAERGHQFVTDFEPGHLLIYADALRIEQIVLNLLTNAAKYTERGGTIWLSACHQGKHVVIVVRDTGLGISPEKLPEMFKLFSQGERSIARSEGGLGIGLTIAQKLAEMHGGQIVASSEGLGKGSEFTVRLPAASHGEPEKKSESHSPTITKKRSRILIVDDNKDIAISMERLLTLHGNDVRVTFDGPSAVTIAHDFQPEYVILDIGLPLMDGYEVAAAIRENDQCSRAVIIGVSGYGQDEDRRRSNAAGFNHHLVKPVDFDSLVMLLD